MHRSFEALLCLTLLTGCEVVQLPVIAVATVTAPIWVPIQYGVEIGKVVQPVAVIDQQGNEITPDYGVDPMGSFLITDATIVCTGDHDISQSATRVGMTCNRNLKAWADFSTFTVRDATISFGAAGLPERTISYLPEVFFTCTGNYTQQSGTVAPFLMECGRNGQAAIAQIKLDDGSTGFKVWANRSN